MVTSNKDAAKIWAEIEKARNVTPKEERGANDLERSIDDLQKINVAMEELPEPSQPFFDWLEKVTSQEKGKSFFDWLLN